MPKTEDHFRKNCYKILRTIPRGRVTTYKAIAESLYSKAFRAVGCAMKKNPFNKEEYPCHRVVKSDGTVGGYVDGLSEKIKKLESEGIEIKNNKIINFKDRFFMPKKS